MNEKQAVDVVIVGAGPAGLQAAIHAARTRGSPKPQWSGPDQTKPKQLADASNILPLMRSACRKTRDLHSPPHASVTERDPLLLLFSNTHGATSPHRSSRGRFTQASQRRLNLSPFEPLRGADLTHPRHLLR